MFIEKYNDFVLIDRIHKTNIYDLSLVITTVVDSLGILVPLGFMVTFSENSSLIDSHLDHLKIDSNPSHDFYGSTYYAIMTDEGSTLVKLASSIIGYNYCICSFHVNQLALRVRIIFMCVHFIMCVHYIL